MECSNKKEAINEIESLRNSIKFQEIKNKWKQNENNCDEKQSFHASKSGKKKKNIKENVMQNIKIKSPEKECIQNLKPSNFSRFKGLVLPPILSSKPVEKKHFSVC